MSYRKFAADHLFTGHRMLGSGHVLVITESGSVEGVISETEAGEGVERMEGVLTPGFINCHCHLELSHLKGLIPPLSGMVNFLLTVMKDRSFPPEQIQEHLARADQAMFESGIVAVGDICNTTDTISHKSKSSLYYHNFIEATGFVPPTAEARFLQALKVYNAFASEKQAGPASIVPHAPYSVSSDLFRRIDKHQPPSLLTMHNQESAAENQFFAEGSGALYTLYEALAIDIADHRATGKSSLLSCIGHISSTHSLLLVHNVLTSLSDLQQVSATEMPEIFWCFCPRANIYINDMLPDIPMFRQHARNLVLGTDSLASNDGLSILEEMKTLQYHFPVLSLEELLGWATINGARALGVDSIYGSFEKGKTPGVVLISGTPERIMEVKAFSSRII